MLQVQEVPRYLAEQPTSAGYVRAVAAPTARELREEHVWARPVPSCDIMPALPHPHVLSPEEYGGKGRVTVAGLPGLGWFGTVCVSVWCCTVAEWGGRSREALWPPCENHRLLCGLPLVMVDCVLCASPWPTAPAGPTEESNWVIPGRILVGAYPSSPEDTINAEILLSILRLGQPLRSRCPLPHPPL